jgi:hypothetical protein
MQEMIERTPEISEEKFVNQCLNLVEKAKTTFIKIKHMEGLFKCKMIEDSLLPKSEVRLQEENSDLKGYSSIINETDDLKILLGKFIYCS